MPFVKTVPLVDVFREILRDRYSRRPALADEIQSEAWFTWPSFQQPTSPEEIAAAKSVHGSLLVGIRKRRVRLQGLDGGQRIDIHPADAAHGKLDVFGGTLKVRGKTYRDIECYEEDVQELLSPSSSTPQALMTRSQAVRKCIVDGMNPPKTCTWGGFCDRVRDLADGWIDKKNGKAAHGFSQKTIERDVQEIIIQANV